MTKAIKTPCVGICSYNDNDLCVGCYRNFEEISNWFEMSDDEREKIMNQLNDRAKKLFE
jgi:predicted Fe-S protein YdhL (DUF1289 family)